MSDITSQILPHLKAFRLPGLHLDSDFVFPDYQGARSSTCRRRSAGRWVQSPWVPSHCAPS